MCSFLNTCNNNSNNNNNNNNNNNIIIITGIIIIIIKACGSVYKCSGVLNRSFPVVSLVLRDLLNKRIISHILNRTGQPLTEIYHTDGSARN